MRLSTLLYFTLLYFTLLYFTLLYFTLLYFTLLYSPLGIDWAGSAFTAAGQQGCMIYAAQYSKEGEGKYIVAGGSGSNEAKVFDHKNENSVIGMYHELRLLPFSFIYYFLLFIFYFSFF